MKYNLRSLMIGVTLFCVLLGAWAGRIHYLRQMASYHEAKSKELLQQFAREENLSREDQADIINLMDEVRFRNNTKLAREGLHLGKLVDDAFLHRLIEVEYLHAMHRPWTFVDETLGEKSQ